jgi:ubiquinone/menaquinone biosynthesis C-methylase UbiE
MSEVRATYDAVARTYADQLGDELDGKPLDRALLQAFLELTGPGTAADVGCGPGHVTRFLARSRPEVIGVDLSPAMIDVARKAASSLAFTVGSMLALPVADGAWAGAVAFYSIIHLSPAERSVACHELARVLRPGGVLLVAFHVDGPGTAAGTTKHLTEWFGATVDIDTFFLDPADVVQDLTAAGLHITSTTLRAPNPAGEYPSTRCYLFAQK